MKVVNLFAGPGTGKSTTAAGLFYKLKTRDIKSELITEYAKDLAWENNYSKMRNQAYLFAKQLQKQVRLDKQVDFAVTDSPIILGIVYAAIHDYHQTTFKPFALDVFNSFDNLNFFLVRKKQYLAYGRNQTEDEAKAIDAKILNMLDENKIPYTVVVADEQAPEYIMKAILNELPKDVP